LALAGGGVLLLGSGAAAAAVGRIEAGYGVDRNGTPEYVIPVRLTAGTAGLTPQLAISHAGASARSVVGVGFTIAGLSAITPCEKTVASDTTPDPIRLQAGDRYCLDGARLRLSSGTYGATNSTYRTEIDQLARVTAYASSSNVPGWFRVENRDGRILEYGNTADSLLRTSSGAGAATFLWAVNKISDRAGNSITFSYDNDDDAHRFRPSQIRYTNRSATPDGHYTISFVYQAGDRPDVYTQNTSSIIESAYVLETRLLERLELRHDGSLYRQYLFSYATGAGGNSRLATLTECAATVYDCLPATAFTWQDGIAGHAGLVSTGTAAAAALPLDFNGDGFDDLVWASGGTWRFMAGGAAGYGAATNTGITATNASKAMPVDWNSDGRADLLVDWSDSKWRVLKGHATGFDSPVQAGPGSGIPSNPSPSKWWIADIDGDGRDDLLRVRRRTRRSAKASRAGGSRATPSRAGMSGSPIRAATPRPGRTTCWRSSARSSSRAPVPRATPGRRSGNPPRSPMPPAT
jgi:hypothetical protein